MAFQQTLANTPFATSSRQQILKPFAIVICCAIVLSTISFINAYSVFQLYAFTVIQLLLFVSLGFFYTTYQRKLGAQKNFNLRQEVILIAKLTCVVCAALCIVYFLYDSNLVIKAFSCSAAFALPFVIHICWLLFNEIPDKEYKIWVPERRPQNKASIFLDGFYLKLKLAKKFYDTEDEVYKVYIPSYAKFGEFFSLFLEGKNKKNTVIEQVDHLKKLYAWEFFITDKYGVQNRRLDPNKNSIDNKLKQSTVIVAKRVEPIKLLNYHHQTIKNEAVKQ